MIRVVVDGVVARLKVRFISEWSEPIALVM
jgi:hypothetical protein